ncbi:NUDIX domain-containing protein [Candidatus Saccharibacteria bacterium]|jgi:ADP-ribose pyrophosphatase|nr:NUDIX domain-containing protein [Candidatus Saccharibacteria bacterium]
MTHIPQKDGPEEIVYQGRIVEVVQQPMKIGEKSVTFESARRAPGVRLIIVDKNAKKIVLTKEFRTELEGYDYRLPGGKVFDKLKDYNDFLSSEEDIIKPATKKAIEETREETGIVTTKVVHFYTSINGATVTWDLLYFVVEEWTQADQQLELGEDISVEWKSFDEAKDIALSSLMSEDRSVAVLLKWLNSQKS